MAGFSKKRAILIGADRYDHVPPLDYCGKDARDVAAAFRNSLEFDPRDVLEFSLESNLKPHRNEIIHQLGEFLRKDIGADDLLIFYFSGHGMIDTEDGKDYLLPLDASPTALSETSLQVEYLAKKLTKTGCRNIVMFVDACRETIGGAKGLASIGGSSGEAMRREGVVTFFSCDPKERSYEIPQLKNGSFTRCVLDAIADGQCATIAATDKYLRDKVPLMNQKYNKPPQLPFTIIQPAEKGELAIFYRDIQRPVAGAYDQLYEKLGVLFVDSGLDEKCFNEAVLLLDALMATPAVPPLDKKRLAFVEALCGGKLSASAFKVAWRAIQRSQPESPPKRLEGLQ